MVVDATFEQERRHLLAVLGITEAEFQSDPHQWEDLQDGHSERERAAHKLYALSDLDEA